MGGKRIRTGKVHSRGVVVDSSTLSLISALEGVGGQRHAPSALYPWERPRTPCIGGWVVPRAGLDGCGESSPATGIRSLDCPASSESLYRLRYPGPLSSLGGPGSILVRINAGFMVNKVPL